MTPSKLSKYLDELERLSNSVTGPGILTRILIRKDIPTLIALCRRMEECIKYYSEDPAYKESSHIMIHSNFRSNNSADYCIKDCESIISGEGKEG